MHDWLLQVTLYLVFKETFIVHIQQVQGRGEQYGDKGTNLGMVPILWLCQPTKQELGEEHAVIAQSKGNGRHWGGMLGSLLLFINQKTRFGAREEEKAQSFLENASLYIDSKLACKTGKGGSACETVMVS